MYVYVAVKTASHGKSQQGKTRKPTEVTFIFLFLFCVKFSAKIMLQFNDALFVCAYNMKFFNSRDIIKH